MTSHLPDLFSLPVDGTWDGSIRRDERSAFSPRPYQVEARAAARRVWSEHGPGGPSPLLLKATGTGKTKTALFIAQDTLLEGGRVVWLAHRRELLSQPLADLRKDWPHVRGGIVQASKDDVDAQVVFASVDTLRVPGRVEAILAHGHPALLVVDEAHRSLSPTHRQAIAALRGPDTLMLGLTATADREDGGDLSELWEIAYTYGPTEAIAGGWLVPPWAAVDKLDHLDEAVADVKSAGGDYDEAELGKALLLAGIVEHTVAAMSRVHQAERLPFRDEQAPLTARGRSTMVFCASVEQAEKTCEALRADGWEARWVCGTTPDKDRSRLLQLFRQGRLQVLVNVMALTEGTDLPIASCIVLARPTRSWSLFVQAVGRGMRLHDPAWRSEWGACNAHDPRYVGKRDCFLLDLAGASALHSIVSAPVLIGGSRCDDAPDGVHAYVLDGAGPKGRCSHCGSKVACHASLGAGNGGKHDWVDVEPSKDDPIERRCSHCRQPQCSQAPNGRHVWAHLEAEQLTICVECDAEVPFRGDSLQSLVGDTNQGAPPEADWIRVARPDSLTGEPVDLVPETWAADIDGQGLVLVVGDRRTALWAPYWIRRGARKPRPLASGPVPREEVRLRCADLLRRARRLTKGSNRGYGGPSAAQLEYARQLGIDLSNCPDRESATREITRAKAWERATALGLARPA